MTIREIIKYNDIDTYKRLIKICREHKRKKKIECKEDIKKIMEERSAVLL